MMTGPDIVSFTEDRPLTTDEIGSLAGLISDETDYYTILGVDYAASRDEINQAYCLAVHFFHPAKCRPAQTDRVLHWKLSCALKRIEEAFSILSNRGRRKSYDEARSRQLASTDCDGGMPGASRLARDNAAQNLLAMNHPNRRRVERVALRLPTVVTLDRYWQETTESEDVSPLGIRLQLSRPVEPGTLLRLDIPMPGGLRTRDFSDEIYAVSGFAIRTMQTDTKRIVAVEFV